MCYVCNLTLITICTRCVTAYPSRQDHVTQLDGGCGYLLGHNLRISAHRVCWLTCVFNLPYVKECA